jgi:hypothetical protein
MKNDKILKSKMASAKVQNLMAQFALFESAPCPRIDQETTIHVSRRTRTQWDNTTRTSQGRNS